MNIARGVTVGDSAVYGCTGITELNIADGVTIGDGAFDGCTGITELLITKGVETGLCVFNFNTVERFSMPEPIMYFSSQLLLSLSELFETLRNKGHESKHPIRS